MAAPPAPPQPPQPPSFDGSSSINMRYINSALDTLDPIRRKKLEKDLSEKREAFRKKTREMQDEMRSKLELDKKEIKRLKQELREGEGFGNLDHDDLAERMSAWGERFGERVASQFDEEWIDKMEVWGENFGEQFAENFDDDLAMGFEEMGEGLAEVFDEEWIEGIEEMAESIAETFDEEWLADIEQLSLDAAELAEEVVAEFEEEFENEDHFYSRQSNRRTKSKLVSALKSDNLLQEGENKITITDEEMKVNGQKMSDTQLKKYQRIISRGNHNAFVNGNTRVEFTIDDSDVTDSKSSLSISVDY